VNATKVNAGLAESNGRLLLGIWRDSLHVTCGLTALHRDQLLAQRSVTSMGKLYLFTSNAWASSSMQGTCIVQTPLGIVEWAALDMALVKWLQSSSSGMPHREWWECFLSRSWEFVPVRLTLMPSPHRSHRCSKSSCLQICGSVYWQWRGNWGRGWAMKHEHLGPCDCAWCHRKR